MAMLLDTAQIDVLRAYAAGQLGTREAIERAHLQDHADLLIGMVQQGLDLPKPRETPTHAAHVAAASAILQPLLRRPV